MTIDLERFRLRSYLQGLGEDHLKQHAGAVDLYDIGGILEGAVPAHHFALPGGSGPDLVGNVMANRERVARAFDASPGQLVTEVLKRLRKPQPIVTVPGSEAPVQQVVLQGDEADLTKLPVHLQHELDGAPYIGAIDFTRDPSTGWTNIGVRRLMLRGRRTAGVDLVAPSDLRALYLGHAKRKEPMPVAFVVGAHPIDYVAATMRMPVDELELLSSLRGAPLGVVKCITNDLLVPADAEYVLEGYFDPHGHVEPEGPYGEFLGYYGGVKRNPLFRLTAITHRRDPLFQTLSISGRTMDRTDTAQLCALRTEVTAWQSIQLAVRELKAVYASAASGGMFNLRVALQQRVPGEARNAIAAAFSCQANIKHVFVVDPDIDIFSDTEMEWALATRFQANRDLVTMDGMRAMPLDPSLEGERTGSKLGFDLTLPLLAPGEQRSMEHTVPTPPFPATPGAAVVSPAEALGQGPKTFAELMRAVGSRDGRELVCWLETQDQAGRLDRDEAGRWRLK
ncbi:UbiD family decarboxylase [Ramlibacter sp. AW1]|uniref:UbiD family decarboxylase n=1 Tax=Ramlibacter aurantiacus TaxID=2801330 RepID=A0A937D469_9BURK|nr:UbiD family decarboxylase [Ramlibacter aurantiacus]MBL0423454.1 UbiD family decarboxylase [Ramlibacter aurantiacus]